MHCQAEPFPSAGIFDAGVFPVQPILKPVYSAGYLQVCADASDWLLVVLEQGAVLLTIAACIAPCQYKVNCLPSLSDSLSTDYKYLRYNPSRSLPQHIKARLYNLVNQSPINHQSSKCLPKKSTSLNPNKWRCSPKKPLPALAPSNPYVFPVHPSLQKEGSINNIQRPAEQMTAEPVSMRGGGEGGDICCGL